MFISLFSYQWLILVFTRVLLRVTIYFYHVTYTFQGEYTLYNFRSSQSKQAQDFFFAMLQEFNVLSQRGLDKYFHQRFLLVLTFSCQCQNIKKGTIPQAFKSNFNIIFQNSSCLVPVQIIFFITILFTKFFAASIHQKVLSNMSK